jgi:hypothetical protein
LLNNIFEKQKKRSDKTSNDKKKKFFLLYFFFLQSVDLFYFLIDHCPVLRRRPIIY